MREQDLLRALRSDAEFKRLIQYIDDLLETAEQFPTHADELIQRVLDSDAEFERLVEENFDLIQTATQFPKHAEALIQRVLSSDAEFKRLVQDNDDLSETARQFPAHAEAIRSKFIALVLSSDAEFKRLIKDHVESLKTAIRFPTYADAIRSKFIALVLSSNAEFERLVQDIDDLLEIAEQFPKHADALIQRVLRDPSLFDDFIQDDEGLDAIKPFCRSIPTVQNANSFLELRIAIKEEMVKKNVDAAFAKLTALDRGGFFASVERPHDTGGDFPASLADKILRDHFGMKGVLGQS